MDCPKSNFGRRILRTTPSLLLWRALSCGLVGRSPCGSPLCMGPENQGNIFLHKVFREPFGSWTSAPKIVDVRTKKVGFLRPRNGEKLFDPWASGREGRERPQEIWTQKFMFMLLFFHEMWGAHFWGTSRWPPPPRFSQKYCDTNGRRIAIQMGGVLRYKWEPYCDTNGRSTDNISLSLERRSTGSTAIQIGGVLQYFFEK